MSSTEARQIVQGGLDRQRADRQRRDEFMDAQERQLRLTINRNHTHRTLSEAQKKAMAEEAAEKRRAERRAAREADRRREEAASLAVRRYIIACGGIVLATLLTPFPWWAAAPLIVGLAVFPLCDVYQLYWTGR